MNFGILRQWWNDWNKTTHSHTANPPQACTGFPLYTEIKRPGVDGGLAHLTLYSDGSYKAGIGGKGGHGQCRLTDYESYKGSSIWGRTYVQRDDTGREQIFFLTWAKILKNKDGTRELQICHGKLPHTLEAEFGKQVDSRFFPEKQTQPVNSGFPRRSLTEFRDRN